MTSRFTAHEPDASRDPGLPHTGQLPINAPLNVSAAGPHPVRLRRRPGAPGIQQAWAGAIWPMVSGCIVWDRPGAGMTAAGQRGRDEAFATNRLQLTLASLPSLR